MDVAVIIINGYLYSNISFYAMWRAAPIIFCMSMYLTTKRTIFTFKNHFIILSINLI